MHVSWRELWQLLDAELAAQHGACGVVAGHAVHAAAGWRGRGAQIHLGNRRAPRVEPWRRPGQRVPQRVATDADFAADEVGVVLGQPRCGYRPDGHHHIAEAGCETLEY